MPIGAIGAVPPTGLTTLARLADTSGAAATAPRGAAGPDFASKVGSAIAELSATQKAADDLAVQAASGSLTDVHDYTIAATEAALATELTVAVRNKALEAFNQIMNLPL